MSKSNSGVEHHGTSSPITPLSALAASRGLPLEVVLTAAATGDLAGIVRRRSSSRIRDIGDRHEASGRLACQLLLIQLRSERRTWGVELEHG